VQVTPVSVLPVDKPHPLPGNNIGIADNERQQDGFWSKK